MYSIIAGLGVSRLLEGIKDALMVGKARRAYWVHSLIVLIGFAFHATTWLSLWALRNTEAWGVWNFLSVLLVPVLLYLFSAMVLPAGDSGDWDLRAYYYANARKIHGLLAAAILVNAFSEYSVLGHLANPTLAVMRTGMFAVLCICAIWSRNETLHRVLVPLILVVGATMPAVLNVEIL